MHGKGRHGFCPSRVGGVRLRKEQVERIFSALSHDVSPRGITQKPAEPNHLPMSVSGDLRKTLLQKAQELFALCDRQGKGYAFKEELGALGEELPLSHEQLDSVFDALDADGDGKLTLQEFSDGFGMFLGIDNQPRSYLTAAQIQEVEDDEDEELEELLDHLGARNLFTDEDYVREMWRRVRKDDPVMRSNFENFIARMTDDLKQSAQERDCLESVLKSREQENEYRVQSLYAEMEEQLRREKEDALKREQWKEQRLRDELEAELQFKDLQLQDMLQKHAQMQKQLHNLNSGEAETKYENKKLEKDRDMLESRLAASERMLAEMKKQMELLRKRSLEEKRKRAQSALKVSEDIALERENLVLELQHLKERNKQLLDEKDELAQATAYVNQKSSQTKKEKASENSYQANIKSEEETSSTGTGSLSSNSGRGIKGNARSSSKEADSHPLKVKNVANHCDLEHGEESFDLAGNGERIESRNNLNIPEGGLSTGEKLSAKTKIESPCIETQPKAKGIGTKSDEAKLVLKASSPSRVFKVVFVGDSGVGKTSILQRFCNDSFKPTFNATIGVDFQIKTLDVDEEKVALQLWDTAGQERFRSMTQQYFRKADGIVIVYDVTSESSFKSVRNWMHSIQEGSADATTLLLIGNKTDVCESEDDRVVKSKNGERIADEFGALFFETSAKTGSCIAESLESLASILKSKEDETMEQVLRLQEAMKEKKRKCC